MPQMTATEITELDKRYVWHPYSAIGSNEPVYPVESAHGCRLTLSDGRHLIDGMSSWWSAIHGYNHPQLNNAAHQQIDRMAHVMFGGLTHQPAVTLAKKLVDLSPRGLEHVFLADSGSVSVEVAIKMAIQYWMSQQCPQKSKLISLRNAYHGDTIGAMSVCDPVTGMHHLFKELLPQNIFAQAPQAGFNTADTSASVKAMEDTLAQHHESVAAVILEPIVQGAGGMRLYSPQYLRHVRQLCDRYNVLLIADEIATGFGRTGKMFACEHADVTPDILCLGKALTGGYMTLAATLCTNRVARGICDGEAGVFMHGPTFMGNPLACAVANANVDLLLTGEWEDQVRLIESQLESELTSCARLDGVKSVRVLGAIGVIELNEAVDMAAFTHNLVEEGIWLRPFGKLVYTMPPYIISKEELTALTSGIFRVLKKQLQGHPTVTD